MLTWKIVAFTKVSSKHSFMIRSVNNGKILKHPVIRSRGVRSLHDMTPTIVKGIASDNGAAMQVPGEHKRVGNDPGHGGQGLRFPSSQQGVLILSVPVLVGEVSV